MAYRHAAWVLAATLGLGATAALADDAPPRVVRVLGEMAGGDGAPRRFVIDALLKPGDEKFHSRVEGWFAGLPAPPSPDGDIPTVPHGAVSGDCVQNTCALSVDVEDGKLALTADLAGPAAPSTGRFAFTDGDDKTAEGAAHFTPITGPVEGLGEIAPPGAVSAEELGDLLMWNDYAPGFINGERTDFDDGVRDPLAAWQDANKRPGAGLILTADLADLRAHAAETRKTSGWTEIGDKAAGWAAGYPAALLPQAGPPGPEHRFTSADGKASLVISIGPPLSSDALSALVDQETAESPDRESLSYTRVNDDMEVSYTSKGQNVVEAFHSREGGLAKLVFSYPSAQEETYTTFETLLKRSFKVGDDLNGR